MHQFTNELNGQLKGLTKSLDKMKKLTDGALNKLPEDQRQIVAPIQAKMSEAMHAIRKGDTSKLQDIVNNIDKLTPKK